MKLKFFFLFILFYSFSYTQSVSKDDLTGVWVAETVSISPKMFSKEETELMDKIKSVFIGAEISFAKNDLMKMELKGHLPEPFNYKMFDKVFYYNVKNGFVEVGHRKNASSIMVIAVLKDANKLTLNFLGVELIVSQTAKEIKLTFDKDIVTSVSSIMPSKPLMFDFIEDEDIYELIVVEQMPIANDCDDALTSEKLSECIGHSLANHVNHKFNTDLAATIGLTGKIRIESEFIIDKDGDIINIESTSPNEKLSNEAIRVINMFPRFKPATRDNEPVDVKYKFPIIFQIQG